MDLLRPWLLVWCADAISQSQIMHFEKLGQRRLMKVLKIAPLSLFADHLVSRLDGAEK